MSDSRTPKPRRTLFRILALLGVLLLLGLYGTTLVFALMGQNAFNLLMASLVATVFVPLILYFFLLMVKNREQKHQGDDKDDDSRWNIGAFK